MGKEKKKDKKTKEKADSSKKSKDKESSKISQYEATWDKLLADRGAVASLFDDAFRKTAQEKYDIDSLDFGLAAAKKLSVDPDRGLDSKRVDELREKFGENRLPEKRRKSFYEFVSSFIILHQYIQYYHIDVGWIGGSYHDFAYFQCHFVNHLGRCVWRVARIRVSLF